MFSFNHVTISVDNLDKTLEFYKKFGFEKYKEYSDENVDIVMLKLGNMILEIFHYQEKEKLPEHSKELAIDLKTIGNKNFVEENKLSDSEIIINKGRLGKPYFFIKDPDGILMEIIEED